MKDKGKKIKNHNRLGETTQTRFNAFWDPGLNSGTTTTKRHFREKLIKYE